MTNPRQLRIAQVAPLWTAVPPTGYGGAELLVHWLTNALRSLGHHVELYASGDSSNDALSHHVVERNMVDAMRSGAAGRYDYYALANLARAIEDADRFDVIHSHVGPSAICMSGLSPIPMVHTVHEGLGSVDEHWLLTQYPEARVVAISASQICTVPAWRRTRMDIVHHGLDVAPYAFNERPEDFLGFIGRMSPRKNPVAAIDIASRVGLPLVLVGAPQNSSETKYFRQSVAPRIDGEQVTHLGEVGQEEKVEFLKNARVILFPIDWEEHFGLVMIEAMACGTPVAALRRGSVPEVVEDGVTGIVCSSVDELAHRLPEALSLDRRAVSERTRERFSHVRMAKDYVHVYETALYAA